MYVLQSCPKHKETPISKLVAWRARAIGSDDESYEKLKEGDSLSV